MNREEALHIFSHSEEIVSANDVNASISGMAAAIRDEMSEDFPLVLSVMGGAAVFTGMLLPHLDFPLEFDYIHLTRYRNTTKGGNEMQWRVAPAESVKDRVVLVLAACAFVSARAAWRMTFADSSASIGPRRMSASESDSPSRYSITMYGSPLSVRP